MGRAGVRVGQALVSLLVPTYPPFSIGGGCSRWSGDAKELLRCRSRDNDLDWAADANRRGVGSATWDSDARLWKPIMLCASISASDGGMPVVIGLTDAGQGLAWPHLSSGRRRLFHYFIRTGVVACHVRHLPVVVQAVAPSAAAVLGGVLVPSHCLCTSMVCAGRSVSPSVSQSWASFWISELAR